MSSHVDRGCFHGLDKPEGIKGRQSGQDREEGSEVDQYN